MSDIITELETLIKQADQWRLHHKANARYIEAAAAAIRIKALRDALDAVMEFAE